MKEIVELTQGDKNYVCSYFIKIKPRWWEFWKYLTYRPVDYSISTEHFTIVWLGGDSYNLVIKRAPAVFETNIEGKKEPVRIVEDKALEKIA